MKKFKFGNIYQTCTNVCFIFVLFFISACSTKSKGEGELTAKPNIVLIVADDLGFGDLGCYGATKIQTPAIDKLANEGVKFSRAYASSSVCSPSRYSILTGRYSWRTRLKWGVLKYYDKPLIEQEEATIASFLGKEGYHTACVGKWHLGMDWALNENAPKNPEKSVFNSWDSTSYKYIDYSKLIKNGPIDRGFDYFYGMAGSNNMQPYVLIENNHVTQPPSEEQKAYDHYINVPKAPNWDIRMVNKVFTEKAVDVINKHFNKKSIDPLFLYFPTSAPHRPCLPTFTKGQSEAGLRGDVIEELDWSVAEVVKALKDNGEFENTLLIFTSDNGPRPGDPLLWLENYEQGNYEDWVPEQAYDYEPEFVNGEGNKIWKEGWITYGHKASGDLLGFKSDAWEGGFRVPLVVSWPDGIKEYYKNNNLVSLTDLYSTIADVIGKSPGDKEGVDSYSFLSNLQNSCSGQVRKSLVLSAGASGVFVAIKDNWKYIEAAQEGRWPETFYPDGPSNLESQLYNLKDGMFEKSNVYSKFPERISEFKTLIQDVQNETKTESALGTKLK